MAAPPHEDSTVAECCTNEEVVEKNLCPQTNLLSNQQQLLDSTGIEFHTNKDSYASDARSLLALKALSPDIQNRVTSVTQTSLSTVIVSPTNEDVEVSIPHSQCIPLKQEQLREHFSETHTAINSSSRKIRNLYLEIQTSRTQDNKKESHSNFKNTVDSTNSLANQQLLMNFCDQPSTNEHYKQPPIEMMHEEQITAASRTDFQDVPIDLSVSSSFRSRLPQSVSENLISDRNAKDIRNPATNYSAELFRKRANPSTETYLQHGAHSSKKPNNEAAEKHPTARSSLAEYSADQTTNQDFVCQKCTRKFKDKKFFTIHIEAHEKQNLFKCDLCPKEFRYKCHLKNHYESRHTKKTTFKCSHCVYASKSKYNRIRHMRIIHKSLLNEHQMNCSMCLEQFIEESKHKSDVCNNNDNPNSFKCYLCTDEFHCKHQLNSHCNTAHKEKKRFKCDLCPHASTSRINLKLHQNTKHKDCLNL